MTKEELYESSIKCAGAMHYVSTPSLNQFFESNICIPKGTNRHPYADVLHEWVENTNQILQWEVDGKYYNSDLNNKTAMGIPLHIKPSEPVYEWQWALVVNVMGEIGRTSFMTQYEFDKNFPPEQGIYWSIDLKTKRVRQ